MDYENKKCLMQFLKLKLVRKKFKNVFLSFLDTFNNPTEVL